MSGDFFESTFDNISSWLRQLLTESQLDLHSFKTKIMNTFLSKIHALKALLF